MENPTVRLQLLVQGLVQGVGFRPYVYRLAARHRLAGFVCNTAFGVQIEVQGPQQRCEAFARELPVMLPPAAKITQLQQKRVPLGGEDGFTIADSVPGARMALISPDLGICDNCRREIFDPTDRRFHYPFTNCTDCGPRFTIVKDIPYDRKNTTMSTFIQCPSCRKEYDDPLDRRFHAQPNACSVCGPSLFYCALDAAGRMTEKPVFAPQNNETCLQQFHSDIASGKVVAVKGLGGFHLACDARSEEAIGRLRGNKHRDAKALALMMRDTETVLYYCEAEPAQLQLLQSSARPIVLLKKRAAHPLPQAIAPDTALLGVMLPYTPLHCLLLQQDPVLVMTSANRSHSPMAYRDDELLPGAQAVLTHNRPIFRRMDDSVCLLAGGEPRFLRRARGYAPAPVKIAGNGVIFAAGGQMNNTFCLAKDNEAFLSGHMGDLDDAGAAAEYEAEVPRFFHIFGARPTAVCCDLHPDYFTTGFAGALARQLQVPLLQVQHHHAHFAGVLAENGVVGPAIGLIFDGTGFGTDGALWGGELLCGDAAQITRLGHLRCSVMPGGEAAVRFPWRMALSMVTQSMGKQAALPRFTQYAQAQALQQLCETPGLFAVTGGMGRLFDAVAALLGFSGEISYEGQAAIALEQKIVPDEACYPFPIETQGSMLCFDYRPLLRALLQQLDAQVPAGVIAARFHNSVAQLCVQAAVLARQKTGLQCAALSGGVFQNTYLLNRTVQKLTENGFTVYTNRQIPMGDGGLAYGQAAVAAAQGKRKQ